MSMAAIFVILSRPFEQTFVPPAHRGSIWNLASTGPVVSEEKMFEECGRRTTTDDRACLYYKLTHEPKDSDELIRTEITILRFHQEMKNVR